jgi:tRNA A37 threonylcarbamoyladenosine modification protein TsaB
VAVDARRGEVYAQLFAADGNQLSSPAILAIEDAALLGGEAPLLVVGSGAEVVAAAAAVNGREVEPRLADLLPDATVLAQIAALRTPSADPVAPLYLRPPDAKRQDGKSIARLVP